MRNMVPRPVVATVALHTSKFIRNGLSEEDFLQNGIGVYGSANC